MMAKPADNVGSDKDELKMLLRVAAQRPINMAFALGSDGKAVIKLDKIKPPKALQKLLKEGDKAAKNHRCGMVSVAEDDPKVVVFIVEKAISGIARKLAVALKGTGFSKARIMLEDGSALEDAAESDDQDGWAASPAVGLDDAHAQPGADSSAPALDADETPTDTAVKDMTSVDDTSGKGRSVAGVDENGQDLNEPAPGADGPEGGRPIPAEDISADNSSGADAIPPDFVALTASPLDAATLTKQLTSLVKLMLGVIANDPSQKSALAELANDAQASIKRGDLLQASAGLDILQTAISAASSGVGMAAASDGAAASPGLAVPNHAPVRMSNGASTGGASDTVASAPADPATQKLAKSQMAWRVTRAKVDAEIAKLVKAVVSASEGDDVGEGFEQEFQQVVTPILDKLDHELTDALQQASAETDGRKRQVLLQEIRKLLDSHRKQVASDPVIIGLDSNPFVPVAIGKTLNVTLTALSSAMA